VYEVINDIIAGYKYPVCFNFPVSHGTGNYALKVGGLYELKVTVKQVLLKEK
jgi:muramoyltetrapeptide carboxypeptidase